MSADFNWWLLLVGMAVGGALSWLVLADSTRSDRDVEDVETAAEAAWIARSLGRSVDGELIERVLRAHRRYLGFPPPDTLVDPDELRGGSFGPSGDSTGDPAGDLAVTPGESAVTPGESAEAAPDAAEPAPTDAPA